MNEDLHRHLDGDVDADGLGPADRNEADEWDRMVASFRSAAPRGSAPAWLEQRVMAEIGVLPERGALARLAAWLLRPEPVRVPPLAAGLVVAAFVAVLLLPGRGDVPPQGAPPNGGAPLAVQPAESVVYVQFRLDAPSATSVAVAGDFSEWEPEFTLEDVDGDGIWTGRIPVRPGVHAYMFLIDGMQWQTDPNADRYRDDGFGNQNAILAVASGV
jgi:hypothetical protein